jgi:hypothetical protein
MPLTNTTEKRSRKEDVTIVRGQMDYVRPFADPARGSGSATLLEDENAVQEWWNSSRHLDRLDYCAAQGGFGNFYEVEKSILKLVSGINFRWIDTINYVVALSGTIRWCLEWKYFAARCRPSSVFSAETGGVRSQESVLVPDQGILSSRQRWRKDGGRSY